jgi:NADH-quinone oxidoreductase subunit F
VTAQGVGYLFDMAAHTRVLDERPVDSFDDYVDEGGGRGLARAVELGRRAVVELVAASGLRGRGGAGFPTGLKWRTVAASASQGEPITVVVNAAEGEPGTFKDRALIRRNPYRMLEGALVAAYAMGAPRVVVATKASFVTELARIETAIEELAKASVATDVVISVVRGPDAYLFGEETALLEVVDGRQPFPRVAPPYRRGLSSDTGGTVLVDNVETLANVPGIIVEGADWFRAVGTDASPGTIVCTVSGDTLRHGVAEFAMGTPIAEVIDSIGRGPSPGRRYLGAISGTANALVAADEFDTPLSYEAMSAAGSGLGTGGLIVFDDSRDLIDIGAAVSHFLAIESCGQCEPCKLDGQAIARTLADVMSGDADDDTVDALRRRVGTVARGARCALARQQEAVIGDLLVRCGDRLDTVGEEEPASAAEPVVIAPIVDLVDGRFVVDEAFLTKQPDWSHEAVDSGKFPVDRLPSDVGIPRQLVPPLVGERTEPAKQERDPVDTLLSLHDAIRDRLDTVLNSSDHDFKAAADALERELSRQIELDDRLLHPMVRRVTTEGDDTVWSAELRALDALRITAQLQPTAHGRPDRRRLDRLAIQIRRNLDDDERIVYPLLRQHLDRDEQTALADAIDEILVAQR